MTGLKSSSALANTCILRLIYNRYRSIKIPLAVHIKGRTNTVIFLSSVRLLQNHYRRILYKQSLYYISSEMMITMRWICIHCNSIMDHTNFTEFIKQSDNDKNSNQEAKVEYHAWRSLPNWLSNVRTATKSWVHPPDYRVKLLSYLVNPHRITMNFRKHYYVC